MPWFVYQVTNRKNGKRYIGKTNDVSRRWYDHRYAASHGSNFYFHRAIRKHGLDNFVLNVVDECQDETQALIRERELIRDFNTQNQKFGYNIAECGQSGNTAQYTIKSDKYEEFRQEFEMGTSQKRIAEIFGVPLKAVISCAKRLNLSFQLRRSIKKTARQQQIATIKNQSSETRKKTKNQKRYACSFRRKPKKNKVTLNTQKQTKQKTTTEKKLKVKMSPEELSNFRATIVTRTNKIRGVTDEIQQQIKRLYFDEDLTAKQIAERLNITHGSVRSTISRAYASMTTEQRQVVGKNNGSWSKEISE